MADNETINIKGPLRGDLEVPGDKSMTHRAMMLSSLAQGESTIYKPLLGEDCLRTMKIFQQLGVDIEVKKDRLEVNSKGYAHFHTPHQVLYTGNSGTTTRLVAGLLSGLQIEAVLSGDASIGKRPMDRVIKPLSQMQARIHGVDNNFTPLIIQPATLSGIDYEMPVASAQVKSAILFAGLFAQSATQITEKALTRNHTETMFTHYHIPIEVNGKVITLPSHAIQHIQVNDFHVPGDISSAAYFIVAALIIPGSDIVIHNVGINSTRSGIIDIVQQMKGNIELFNITEVPEPTASIRVRYTESLQGIDIQDSMIPRAIDEIPIIALLCTQAQSTSRIRNAEELKVKETNRIDTTVSELNKLGFDLTPTEDGMIIRPSRLIHNVPVDSHTDHRIGMMLAIASLLTDEALTIERFDAVNVSFPDFLTHLQNLKNEG
ncbi:3-phosphoshikimate 1-carboxyvinyltransferase [Staphylococcus pettenkoferi]